MHILSWNVLRLLHGLCFLEIVEGFSVEISKSGDRIVTSKVRTSVEDFKMIQILEQNAGAPPEVDSWKNRVLCLNDLCKRVDRRTKRDLEGTNKLAHNNRSTKSETDENHQHNLKSKITPYAFGNPSLPGQQKKGKKRPKKSKG